VPVAPYNARNTDDPKDIEYRVEARIDEHSEDVQLKQSTLDETYNRRVGVERTNDAVRTAASGTFAPEAASTHEHKCIVNPRAVPSSDVYAITNDAPVNRLCTESRYLTRFDTLYYAYYAYRRNFFYFTYHTNSFYFTYSHYSTEKQG